ncbi:hypothetical protein [Fibrobacter sp. UWEL]|uniref:hypothetical protein n=1 Tax=Fibrobacter sp. UWEL TaxID=1896209 RepID=UPI0009112B87|nr:hypothetical protein [Fibrobacter sp. UWEL]SHL51633.1 hypothetical protein SAMN05720468_13713 [Fibrobacter sp. UWEL]
MKKNLFLFLQGFLALFFVSCSDTNGVADGGSIEDQNAISVDQLNEWYKYGTGLHEAAYAKIDGGRIAVLNDGTGARAECIADSSTLAMTIQISGSFAIFTLQGTEIAASCDSSYSAFKAGCLEKSNSQFFSISDGCKNGNFDAACRMSQVESDSISMLISYFSNVAADRCAEMAKDAQSSTGKFESPSSSSKRDDISSSSSSIDAPEICENCGTTNNQAISIDSSRTLENYILQYVPNAEQLSFDNRVVAYNGTASMACMDYAYAKTGISPTDMVRKSPLFQINRDDISVCFPMTAKIMKEHPAENKEGCRYFMTMVDDGGQPMGHVLTSISDSSLQFTSISPGGKCKRNNNFFAVYFLIEDCDGSIGATEPESIRKPLSSEIWKCEDGSYSPSTNAISYGEWFKSSLL